MELGAFTRPKHEEALSRFLEKNWKPVQRAIDEKDFHAFEAAFHKAIKAANAYHELKDKPYLVWKLPETPPPDLDLRPRRKVDDSGATPPADHRGSFAAFAMATTTLTRVAR